MIIRQEKPGDINDIHALNELAFGQPQEANFIDCLMRVNITGENKKIVRRRFNEHSYQILF
jgi:predicted N-acetyltransferase YhbS